VLIGLPTDFEQHGLVERWLRTDDRAWLLTIDFEAFTPEALVAWLDAMQVWARLSAEGRWRFSIFLAVEDVVRLRAASESLYDGFLRAAKALSDAGTTFHPHNHGVFDSKTGLLAAVRPQHIPGYRKRASFAYDVVHRHRVELADWVAQVVDHYDEFLVDARIPRPRRLAFRAGGWDYGDTAETSRAYIRALEQSSFSIDSSASSGVFGTKSWRVGAPFGSNIFALSSSLVELAPCWSMNCGVGVATRQGVAAVARLLRQPGLWLTRTAPGAFVTVLHFDHLFCPDGQCSGNGLASRGTVEKRVNRFFELIAVLRGRLKLESTSLEDLEIEA
jgi:hypothetical protein